MKDTIVVTGGAGFVGSNLIKYFVSKTKLKIISIDNYSSGSIKNHIQNKRITYINGNTVNIKKLLKPFQSKINVIFHFGEFSRIHQSFVNISDCISSNISGTSEVFKFCLEKKLRSFTPQPQQA